MSHNVENMMFVGATPWHGLGVSVDKAPTAEEAIKLAGLDWQVLEKQISYYHEGLGTSDNFRRIQSHKALIRSSDFKILGVVGENYKPLQNDKAFSFFDPFIESGLASFETAGSLRGGKTVWILAKLNKAPIEIGRGDEVNKYLMISNGHDGTMAVRVGFTPIRVVCNNTLSMSHSNEKSKLIRITHSRNVNQRVEQVRDIVNAMDAKFEATAEQYQALAKSEVSLTDLEKYVDLIFVNKSADAQRREYSRKKHMENIKRLFETGRGQDLKGARGTYWGLYNAVTEHLTWENGRNNDNRLSSLWFGGNKNLNQKAFDLAFKMAVGQ